ncbi:hypothetical protein AMECASPLE_014005 [Ameca splendens]|uniref:Uncharacterized protein n=1 Tax=Ameca splendens TaxID=208324 RepID=A0ABV0ZAD3_9TELE
MVLEASRRKGCMCNLNANIGYPKCCFGKTTTTCLGINKDLHFYLKVHAILSLLPQNNVFELKTRNTEGPCGAGKRASLNGPRNLQQWGHFGQSLCVEREKF